MVDHAVLAIVGIEQFNDFEFVRQKINTYLARMSVLPRMIISGENPGPNQMAKDYAVQTGVEYRLYPIDWENDGRGAAHRRDDRILNDATHIIIFTDNSDERLREFINRAFDARKNVLKVNVAQTAERYISRN